MAKTVIIPQTPPQAGMPRVDFQEGSFENLLWQKGYSVIWERALPCPCVKKTANKSGCKNCQGTGWIFYNPTSIKAVLTSINRTTKYKEWGQELLGTVAVTCESRFDLGYMDRLTLSDSLVNNGEALLVRKQGLDNLFTFTTFRIQSIIDIFIFVDVNTKLTRLEKDIDFTFDQNKITFISDKVSEGTSLTASYKYNPEYHILDFQHDIRNSSALVDKEERQLILPISAIARRAMNVSFDRQNFDGTSVLDNSYVNL